MTAKKPGRPQEPIDRAIAADICEWISQGETLIDWCERNPGWPAYRTIRKWIDKDPEFEAAYTQARIIGADAIAERMRLVASEELKKDDHRDEMNRRRLMIDTDKWLLARWFPRAYGDKLAIGGDSRLDAIRMTDEQRAQRIKELLAIAEERKSKLAESNGNE